MKEWVNDLNTTSFRITISVIMAAVLATVVTFAIVVLNWLPTSQQITVLTGVAGLILTMMGFDVLQYATKRRTDSDYVAAKQGPSPVNVEAPSTVSVQPATAEQPAAVSVAPIPTPAAGRTPEAPIE